ncbi:hypothetical protein AU381_00055 [Sinorhizobium glycinis]|uniref:Uncharacterized protein n=1 Tax=Sinorhizobium glycinis TaxID=1472378 RepID=A0A178XYU0_9HYPH|nr:hypothetical protein [Sinorhizobium glycinis]OAP40356.1 hypothetical protein AU381_00055 [Sinorhizobium glycinis]
MTVLNINGRRVQVDDSFKSLSPEQQAATVDEIAKSFDAPAAAEPEAKAAPAGRHLSYEEGLLELEKERQNTGSGKAGAFGSGFIGDIPIVGPALLGGVERAAAGISSLIDGEDYATNLEQGQRTVQAAQEANPGSRLAGSVAGNVAAFGALGSTAAGARALGITGPNLLSRAGASALSSGGISAADTAVRGGNAADVINSGVIGGAIGGAVPVVGAGVRGVLGAVGEKVAPAARAVLRPAEEASRRVGVAVKRDRLAGDVLNSTDEAVARSTGVPLLNVDRGGETTRALARSVSNQAPEARQVITKVADDRFATQGNRAVDVIRRVAGGSVDDIGYQDAIRTAARRANKPAYDAAYASPNAQQVFTPRIQQLMQSPSFRRAIDTVPRKSADRGAITGAKEIPNPFTQNSQGQYVLKQKADGTLVTPSLEFWDHVQRNLRSASEKAARAGDTTTASEIGALRTALNNELDTAVPTFKNARQGAAAFFGADDAVEAGKKFAGTPRLVPEAQKAYAKFTPAEKAAFQTGYASELIDRIKAAGDRTNVINSVFKSQASRESLELVFGPQKAKALEAYVRVEDIADRLRGAMGNSTTARQLVELGLGAGGGYAISGGDLTGAVIGGLAVKGGRALQSRAENQVMQAVAKMLTSNDPRAIANAVTQAEKSPAFMKALEQIGDALAIPSRAIPRVLGQEPRQPLEITVTPRQ